MARGVSYQLTGLRDLTAVLERASVEVRTAVERVNRDTAYAIRDRAKGYAPRDKGDLIASISVDGKGMNWRVGLRDARIPSRGGHNSAHLNPSVYGTFIEYGTKNYPRHPFMRPAVDAERGRYEERLNAAARGLTTTLGRVA